ncbi:GntR family transcriptional regulator [Streptomyces sp. NPDC005917]|uniref:GntR family transcriptional regulator n=1 Tax=unclassified Streptomyces TaxID=2593676 RepID=UPI0033E685FF
MTLPALTAHSLSDQAYRALRTAIVNGDLPWGKKITERGLAESLGVSPTPVREALRRLEQEQLVERTGPRTLTVATVSPEARTECGTIEAALEGVAARFAAEKATEHQLAELERLLDTADEAAAALQTDRAAGRPLNPTQVERIFDAVRAFHSGIEEAAGSAQLARALEQVRAFSRSERLSIASAQLAASAPGPVQRYGQHREILTALQQRDAERAEHLARTHAASGAADLAGWDA